MGIILELIFILILQAHLSVRAAEEAIAEKKETKMGLPPREDRKVDKPLEIGIFMFVEDINGIDAQKMEFDMEYYIIHSWNITGPLCDNYYNILYNKDDQVEKMWREDKQVPIPLGLMSHFWIPDTYFLNAKLIKEPSAIVNTKSLRININHTDSACSLEYIGRCSAKVGCQMNLRSYPSDIQECISSWRSFSFDQSLLRYKWTMEGTIPNGPRKGKLSPVIWNEGIQLLQHDFKIEHMPIQNDVEILLNTSQILAKGKFCKFEIKFLFERNIANQMIGIFAPSALIVMLTWLSFWLEESQDRVTLSITSLVALVTMFAQARDEIPPVSYITFMDVWMIVSMLFDVGALFVVPFVVNYKLDEKNKAEEEKNKPVEYVDPLDKPFYIEKRSSKVQESYTNWQNVVRVKALFVKEVENKSNPIDRVCRIVFPGSYSTFILGFMMYHWID